MEYDDRFTNRVVMKEDPIDESQTYLARVSDNIILNRLGLYEDLGFSPAELADMLLDLEYLNKPKPDYSCVFYFYKDLHIRFSLFFLQIPKVYHQRQGHRLHHRVCCCKMPGQLRERR